MDIKTLATQWRRQVAGLGKQALQKASETIELFKDPSPEELRAAAAAAEAAAKPISEELSADTAPSTGAGAFDTLSLSMLMLTIVVGLVVASLTLLSERKPSTSAEASSASASEPATTSAAPAAESLDLPLPPSALPPPPSAPMGATMMMDASYVAVGNHDSNGPRPEDFEIVKKPKWHERLFR